MAKRLLALAMPGTAGRCPDQRLLPGERLTGRYLVDGMNNSAPVQVEVWDKGYLILKSKSIPTGWQNPYTDLAVLGAWILDGRWGDEVSDGFYFKKIDDNQNIERIVSAWTTGFGSAVTLYVEIESPD